MPTLYDRYGRPLGPVVRGPRVSANGAFARPRAPASLSAGDLTVGGLKQWPQGGDPPEGWPHGGQAMPPYHYPNNPIDTYHRQQEGDTGGQGEPPPPPGKKHKERHREVEHEEFGSASMAKVETILNTMLQYEASQFKPRGRLGATVLLTTVKDPSNPTGDGLVIPDMEVARLEGLKAGTRVTLYSKNGPFSGLSAVNPGTPLGPQDFSEFGNGFPPRVLLKILIGGGNAAGGDNTLQVVPAGVPVTVAGESIYVVAGVYLDELGLSPFFMTDTGNFSVTVSAFLSVQGDSVDTMKSQWVIPVSPLAGVGGIETDLGIHVYGPRHLKQAHGFANPANAATTYLMFFDWNGQPTTIPPNGTIPLFTIPLPPGLHFSWDCITSSRKFEWGVVWALSTSPDFFVFDDASTARVDLELYADLQVVPIIA
jgi:hypothetical protein